MTTPPNSPPDLPTNAPSSNRVQAKVLPAREGWDWIKQGWKLFRRQPMGLTGILSMYIFAMLLASLLLNFAERALVTVLPAVFVQILAALGAAAIATTVPGVTAGFMAVCKNVLANKPIRFDQLLQGFRGLKRTRNQLLALGGVQVLALALVVAISPDPVLTNVVSAQTTSVPAVPQAGSETKTASGASSATTPATAANSATSTPNAADDEIQIEGLSLEQRKEILFIAALQMLLYMPITVLLWYAPMLVYWKDCSAIKAMFFSAAAIWRNRGAFTVYGLGLTLILFITAYVMAMILVLLGLLLGIGKTSLALLAPFVMALLSWTYCTIYFSYTSVFGDPLKAVAPEPPATATDAATDTSNTDL